MKGIVWGECANPQESKRRILVTLHHGNLRGPPQGHPPPQRGLFPLPWWFQKRIDNPKTKVQLHPRKLTCPLKRCHFNRKYIFQPLIFRGHLCFPGNIFCLDIFWPPASGTSGGDWSYVKKDSIRGRGIWTDSQESINVIITINL